MKKLFSLVLTVVFILSCVPAFGKDSGVTVADPNSIYSVPLRTPAMSLPEPQITQSRSAEGELSLKAAPDYAGFEKALIEAINKKETEVDIRRYNIPNNTYTQSVYYGIAMRYPQYLIKTAFSGTKEGDNLGKVYPLYLYNTDNERKQMLSAMNSEVNSIKAVAQVYPDTLGKIMAIHDEIVKRYGYYAISQNETPSAHPMYNASTNPMTDYYNVQFHMYGLAKYGTGVCQGISQMFYAVATDLGIDVDYCTNEGHMWNLVKIDGVWYHMDATWDNQDLDDRLPESYSVDVPYHKWFMCSDEAFAVDHKRNEWDSYGHDVPDCSSKKYETGYMFNVNFYVKIGYSSENKYHFYLNDGYENVLFSYPTLFYGRLMVSNITAETVPSGKTTVDVYSLMYLVPEFLPEDTKLFLRYTRKDNTTKIVEPTLQPLPNTKPEYTFNQFNSLAFVKPNKNLDYKHMRAFIWNWGTNFLPIAIDKEIDITY